METVVIKVNSRSDSRLLEKLAKKMGFETLIISDFDLRMQARKRIVEIVETNPVSEVNEEEIQSIVDRIRIKKHDKN
jgi:hypothetical protein